MENIEMTNMCMIENLEKNEVLVQDRKKTDWKGIAFPGGHIEQGEGIIDSTIREIKEETGLDISDLCLVGIKHGYFVEENRRYMVFLFKTSVYAGTLIEQTEEGNVFWINKDMLPDLNLANGFENTFEVINNPLLHEERHFVNQENADWECVLL